ncbi:TIGR02757 family protein [Treponema bryantii]|uniref:TIGR02757 family protein n=1 Tax=Treponema bryantii TaxID=163 RepID=UPI0003B491BB|nr:TIGR02757 family protein [Treponema bryantii]
MTDSKINISDELKVKLRELADRYEVASFTKEDPSQFLRWYRPEEGRGTVADVEAASFIAAMLAFGSRKQFISKIREILETSDRSLGSITEWLKQGKYTSDFPRGAAKFYRFYSYDDMQVFFEELRDILKEAGSLGEFVKAKMYDGGATGVSPVRRGSERPRSGLERGEGIPLLHEIVSSSFPKSAIVPKGRSSANKRIHMFLRWMVRRGSPVDLGIWDWADPASLLIPLDVHVMQEAAKLGLIAEGAAASRKTAECLTAALAEVFPGDPCRGDFALFGLGVDVL